MILRRLLAFRDWTALVLALLVGLQIAVAPLSDAAARGGPAPDLFSVICSHAGTAAAPQDQQNQQDRHPAGKGNCCEAGCLMGVAGLAAPAKDFKRLDHAVTISTGRAGFAPDTIAPSARPHEGAPQTPRGPPFSIG